MGATDWACGLRSAVHPTPIRVMSREMRECTFVSVLGIHGWVPQQFVVRNSNLHWQKPPVKRGCDSIVRLDMISIGISIITALARRAPALCENWEQTGSWKLEFAEILLGTSLADASKYKYHDCSLNRHPKRLRLDGTGITGRIGMSVAMEWLWRRRWACQCDENLRMP